MSKREKMLALVQDYKDSGLYGKAYCQTHGVVLSTLYYWIKKFEENTSPGGFVQIKPRTSTNKTIELTQDHKIQQELDILLMLSVE